MDHRSLRHFLAVADHLHFGRAAEMLNMTQPPLSMSIQALEEELGVTLFVRSRRKVELTPAGRQWLPFARAAADAMASLPATARKLARGELGSLQVSFVSTANYNMLPDLVGRFRLLQPDVQITLRELTTDLQIEALLAGDSDAGLIIGRPGTPIHASFTHIPLLREPLIAAVPECWIDAGRIDPTRPIALARLVSEPFILFPRRSAPTFHDIVTSLFAETGMPEIIQEAIQMQTIVGLVSSGLGFGLVPQSLSALRRSGVRYLPIETTSQIETGLVYRTGDPSPALAHFVALARETSRLGA